MAKQTRLATTITTHYTQQQGAADAFYMDGRLSSPQKYKDADITLDRTDEGFYIAIFASTDLNRESNRTYVQKKRSLDRITELIKDENRGNIDSAINDMAENAVHVTGRLGLTDATVRHPYYSGVLIRDGEMAAVTMASGLAYLYRDETLYPLTQDDFKLEARDAAGRPVDNFDIYGAGRAGTIRYSNISQIQVDDCIILCTREVMETIGQQGMLELLDQAYDQAEAAERVADLMAQELPNTPFQFLMSFVEDVFTPARNRRDKRGDTGIHRAITNVPISETAMTDETARFNPQAISPYSAAAAGLVPPMKEAASTAVTAAPPANASQPIPVAEQPTTDAQQPTADAQQPTSPDHFCIKSTDNAVGGLAAAFMAKKDKKNLYDYSGSTKQPTGDDTAVVPPVSAGEQAEDAASSAAKPAAFMSAAESLRRELPDDNESWASDDVEQAPYASPKKNRGGRILLTILVILLLAAAFLAVAYILDRNKDNQPAVTTEPSITASLTEAPTESSTTVAITETTAATTTTVEATTTVPTTSEGQVIRLEGAEGGTYASIYEVQPGDSFARVFAAVYDEYDTAGMSLATVNQLIGLFVEANPDTISGTVEDNNVTIYYGTFINVPDPSTILELKPEP